MIEPLPEALRALITAEGAAPVVSEVAQAAVRAKLGATLGIAKAAAATTTVAATTAGTAVKVGTVLKILLVTVGVGTVTTAVVATRGTQTAQRASAPVIDIAATPARDADSQPDPVREVVPEPAVAEASAPPVAVRPAPVAATPPTPSQAKLLADASRAFSNGEAALALQLLDDDERHHAQGPLGEERDALRVSVLVALGRTADAKQRSRELLARYPNTIHRALVQRVLKEPE